MLTKVITGGLLGGLLLCGIRSGVESISKYNKERQERATGTFIPEVALADDGDAVVFRILTDAPIDAEFHSPYDPTLKRRNIFYCTYEDKGECELCNRADSPAPMFMFWVYVRCIFHTSPDDEGKWEAVKRGSKTFYREEIGEIQLLRRGFGRGGELWEQFANMFVNYGTFKDRDYVFARKGVRRDINTTYTLTPLDKEPMDKSIAGLIPNLPQLAAVARGEVKTLEGLGVPARETREKLSEPGKLPRRRTLQELAPLPEENDRPELPF